MKYYAIIVAGGSGSRMQSAIPKQFLELNGLPIIMHTIKAFYQWPLVPKIIVVMHPDYHKFWKKLCADYKFTVPHKLIEGGKTRFESVKKGLSMIEDDGLVAIHDAVRPIISTDLLINTFKMAEELGNAIPVIKCRDSIRKLQDGISIGLDREQYFLVQTPQCFQVKLINEAYKQEYKAEFTDDASVVEAMGVKINLTEGDSKNIKITFPEDLRYAESLLK
ncbi:2-C-methyl-D-erythritol 4-phosphate cytidylyltransferase [Solitalea koreensis]|uniref:2-C-methyl-D-erythritol 4-phosphate cytidylyltransferase n=1 Tax=Solitalea koreensis TaxID=543615 RepID=A0A521DES2_9SPHI|nr:2-C-methyl-D-erythritol 4-phosphate cytidylyltransferase [Solitalea koreensis]SMO69460.1 2-C-methyl-D-erythritol 4-phosphate cytidylyltransferase [Solitalea koreensis]